jgi:uncharacterized protein YdaU (DUF1376 family)
MHYYQFNIGDYLSHTKHLSPIEDICYRRLLDFYYLHEQPIPNDLAKVTRLLCLNKEYLTDVEQVLNEFFMLTPDGWINERADKEIKQYQSFKTAGAAGAAKRWAKPDNSNAIGGLLGGIAKANAKQETITTNHKPLTNIKPIRANALDNGFEEFWQAYPKKVGKDAAAKSWTKTKARIDDVLPALAWQKESDQWRRNDGQFIPNPATYLNQGRWHDEQPVVDMNPF